MRVNGLSVLLWRERELLQALLLRLEEERRSLDAAPARWPTRATAAVDGLLEELRLVELGRAAAAEAVARELGAGSGTGLGALVELAPPPWAGLLAEHHDALRTLTEQVARASAANRRVLAHRHAVTVDALLALQDRALAEAGR